MIHYFLALLILSISLFPSQTFGKDEIWYTISPRTNRYDNFIFFSNPKTVTENNLDSKCFINFANFNHTKFQSVKTFISSFFLDGVSFNNAEFSNNTSFSYTHFLSDCSFDTTAFKNQTWFDKAEFGKKATFHATNFGEETTFFYATFFDDALFKNIIFSNKISFKGCCFLKYADFSSSHFNTRPDFEDTTFTGPLNISGCKFNDQIDFTRTTFKDKIYFDSNTDFSPGKLFVHWDKIEGKLEFDAAHMELLDLFYKNRFSKNIPPNEKAYNLSEIFYNKLRDNYIAQGDKESADKVMYELASKQQEYKGDTWGWIYGITFGWGYQPIRFIAISLLTLIPIFSLIWYNFFYHRIILIVDSTLPDDAKAKITDPLNIRETKISNKVQYYSHTYAKQEISLPARLWHVLFFSTSVLLSIRFNKEWIARKDNMFLSFVTLEWLLGIGLYYLFFTFVKSYEFEFIKNIFSLSSP
jgi:hypothetical protein